MVDAGNSLFARFPYNSGEVPALTQTADFVLNSCLDMGYDAVNIGFLDWAGGTEYLLPHIRSGRYPFVSANLGRTGHPDTLTRPCRILEVCGLKIGIVGLMSDQHILITGSTDIAIADPLPVARELVSTLRKECALVVLLSDLGEDLDAQIAEQVEGISVIIDSGHGAARQKAMKVKDSYIFHPGSKGQALGRIDITLAPDRRITQVLDTLITLDETIPEDEKTRSKL